MTIAGSRKAKRETRKYSSKCDDRLSRAYTKEDTGLMRRHEQRVKKRISQRLRA